MLDKTIYRIIKDRKNKKDKKMTKEREPQTSLLEDLEDLVRQLQSDKITEDQVVEILSNIVKYEKDKK